MHLCADRSKIGLGATFSNLRPVSQNLHSRHFLWHFLTFPAYVVKKLPRVIEFDLCALGNIHQ